MKRKGEVVENSASRQTWVLILPYTVWQSRVFLVMSVRERRKKKKRESLSWFLSQYVRNCLHYVRTGWAGPGQFYFRNSAIRARERPTFLTALLLLFSRGKHQNLVSLFRLPPHTQKLFDRFLWMTRSFRYLPYGRINADIFPTGPFFSGG